MRNICNYLTYSKKTLLLEKCIQCKCYFPVLCETGKGKEPEDQLAGGFIYNGKPEINGLKVHVYRSCFTALF